MAKRIDLKLGFQCNNVCSFCVQGDKRHRYAPKPLEEVYSCLEEGRYSGAEGVVFTGGEPTVHATLLPGIQRAKKLGYTTIQIQSNGRRFADETFLKSLIEAGANEFSPALHGAHARTHDMQVGVKGAYQHVLQGLQLLQKYRQKVIMNTVITQQNMRELPMLAHLFVKLGVFQMQFAFVHILGSAAKNYEVVVPKKSEVMPYVHKALRIAKDGGVFAMTEAIPLCFMQGYEEHVAEQYIPETTVFDAEHVTESYTAYRQGEGKLKPECCRECSLFHECEGPWKEYIELYGDGELHPVL